jgi:hypothetical protein
VVERRRAFGGAAGFRFFQVHSLTG